MLPDTPLAFLIEIRIRKGHSSCQHLIAIMKGEYVNASRVSGIIGFVPGAKGGYFPPFILELLSNIVSSFIEGFSPQKTGNSIGFSEVLLLGICPTGALGILALLAEISFFRFSAFAMRDSHVERHRERCEAGAFVLEATERNSSIAFVYSERASAEADFATSLSPCNWCA
jgi:hypothetical protein